MARDLNVDLKPERPSLERQEEGSTSFTPKALLIGAALSLFLSIGAPYGNMVIRGSWMALDFSTAGALFLFFFLVGILNTVLKLAGRSIGLAAIFLLTIAVPYGSKVAGGSDIPVDFTSPGMIFSSFILVAATANFILTLTGRRLALEGGELMVVYIMMIFASAICTLGLSEYLLPIITSPFYYASPENNWAELFHPYAPRWMVLGDADAVKYFYEGLPEDFPIPWGTWIEPLIYWGAFVIVLYLVMICMMVILRKQWMERERLIYPITQVPLEMIRGGGGSLISPFFKSAAMWIGFSIPFIVSTVKALHNYYGFIPSVSLGTSIPIFRRTTFIQMSISFPMIGFSYLINSDIALGLWFFHLMAKIQKGVFNILGIASTERTTVYGAFDNPLLAHQGMGAIMVLVLFGLWMGRGHLKNVFAKALGIDPDVDDSGEILSYRAAVLGLIGGLLFMGIWLWRSGLPAWATALFLFGAFLIFVGLTRIVVESGVAAAVASTISPCFVVSGVGSSVLGPAGMTALAFTFVWCADIRTHVMASCAHGLKLGEGLERNKRPIFWVMMLAIVVSLVGSVWMILNLSYKHGGINLSGWFFRSGPQVPFQYAAGYINSPSGPSWWGWVFIGIGACAMILLMLARQRFLWWPLHPLGFPIGAVWMMDVVWFSIFLAWLLKLIILKYGGPRAYRGARPFFLGLILGQFVAAGVWLVVDYFTGMTDNIVYWV